MNANNPQLQLQVGGQLNPRKHVFVSRQDLESELLEALLQGEYCNLLSSRQVTAWTMAEDPVAARAKAASVRAFVEQRQRETMSILGSVLNS